MNFILKDFSFDELEHFVVDNGFPKYRAQQIYSWLYKHGAANSKMMHNLSDDLKLFLDQNCTFETLSLSIFGCSARVSKAPQSEKYHY